MAETKPAPKKGDPCPSCGGAFRDVRPATDDERRRTLDRENPQALMPNVDYAPKRQIEELGTLAKCGDCGYRTRYAPETGDERSAREAAQRRDAGPATTTGQPPA